jgi:hypothetical protein
MANEPTKKITVAEGNRLAKLLRDAADRRQTANLP